VVFGFFKNNGKRRPDQVLNTMTESDKDILSLILIGGFWFFQKQRKKKARPSFKHDD